MLCVSRDPFNGHLEMLLLSTIAAQPMHGYAIIERIRRRSDGVFDYAEGTVYPALRRLEDEGCVKSRWDNVDGRRRRVYEISRKGRKELATQRQAWERFSRGVEAALGG